MASGRVRRWRARGSRLGRGLSEVTSATAARTSSSPAPARRLWQAVRESESVSSSGVPYVTFGDRDGESPGTAGCWRGLSQRIDDEAGVDRSRYRR